MDGNTAASLDKPGIWTPTFINIIFISLAVTGSVDALQAALPVYMEQLGRSPLLGGLTVTVFTLAAIVPSLIAGRLADAVGCRQVMIAGAALFAFGMLLPLLFSGITVLLLARAVQGIGYAVVSVAAAAGATNVLPHKRLGEGVGYFGVGQSLAMALGPMLGLALIADGNAARMWGSLFGVTLVILLAACFCFCDRKTTRAASCRPAVPAAGPGRRASWAGFIEKRAILPALMILIFCTGICGVIVFAGLYALQLGFGNAGPFFIAAAAAMLAVRFGSGLFMDKYQPLTILLPSLLLTIAAFLLLAFTSNRLLFYGAGIPLGLGFGVVMPLLSALAVKRTPKRRWGAANATFYLCVNLGFGTGSFFGGLAIDAAGFRNAFLLGILTAVIPGLLGLVYLRRKRKNKPRRKGA